MSSIGEEFREGEILPPNDIVEEWLKLIDADPENVVGISLRDKKRTLSAERRII
jgi:proteasome-associated ATPase